MKKFLLLLALVSITALVSASYAADKDHVPKVEKVSKQDVENAVVTVEFPSVETYAIYEDLHSTVLVEEAEHSPPRQEEKSGKLKTQDRSVAKGFIPRIRDKGRW